jgi:hypothetical protein
MKLAASELGAVCSVGLYITEKCDGCQKLLNQTFRYTIISRPQVYCSAVCRDSVFFGNWNEGRKHSTPGRCAYCRGSLKGKRRGALYCDEICKKALRRKNQRIATAEGQKSGTANQ